MHVNFDTNAVSTLKPPASRNAGGHACLGEVTGSSLEKTQEEEGIREPKPDGNKRPWHSSKPRILIVDDHDLVREGLAALLEAYWNVCGQAGNGIEAIEKVRELRPDMVLLDLSMPIMSGTQAAKSILKIAPGTKIVFLSMHDSPTVAELVRTIGAAGFISKHTKAKEFRESLVALLNHIQ